MNRNVSILQELQKTNLCGISYWDKSRLVHLDPSRAVEEDALLDVLDRSLAKLTVQQCVLPRVLDLLELTKKLLNLHFTSCDSACLATQNLIDFAHLLGSIKIFD